MFARKSISTANSSLTISGDKMLDLREPVVMGVLNLTPDSFSDGGKYDNIEQAIERAMQMEKEGAGIIDIGGESSRPGAKPITAEEEQRRVLPVIKALRKQSNIPISIDSFHAQTAKKATEAGADIINDISALRFDRSMVEFLENSKHPVILMHMQGTPLDMQKKPSYENCVAEIADFFEERISFCKSHNIGYSRIVLDPGIGFGKRLKDNLEILSNLSEFMKFGLPLLVGASRKSFIDTVHKTKGAAEDRIGGSIAAALMAVTNGASIIRAHDVGATVEAIKVMKAIEDAG